MRGTHGNFCSVTKTFGNTPAYAGNTALKMRMRIYMEEHPRVCGEHGGRMAAIVHGLGTPPRMRGTQSS